MSTTSPSSTSAPTIVIPGTVAPSATVSHAPPRPVPHLTAVPRQVPDPDPTPHHGAAPVLDVTPVSRAELARARRAQRAHPAGRGVVRDRLARARGVLRAVSDDAGAATAEYAIVVLAAVGFAGLLVVILRGNEVKSLLTDLIHRALAGG